MGWQWACVSAALKCSGWPPANIINDFIDVLLAYASIINDIFMNTIRPLVSIVNNTLPVTIFN